MTAGALTPAPVSTPTKLSVIIPYPNQTARPASAKTPTPAQIISTPQVFPPWVADFSDPILKSLEGQYPVYQDDFPAICLDDESHYWKVCSTPEVRTYYQNPLSNLPVTARPTLDTQPDLQHGYSLLNTGWFFDVPGSLRNPSYAHIDNGALVLKLPEGKINKDLMVYNPHLARKNFVLKLNFEFRNTRPSDTVRFQFNQSADQSVALDISRNKTWAFQWGFNDNRQSRTGVYERFTPERISVVIIVRDTECAVYFNNDPLDHFSDCRTGAMVQASKQAVSLHLIGEPGYSSSVTVDNVILWDLDKIP
jgi:hypothetical protein